MADQSATSKFIKSSLEQFIKAVRGISSCRPPMEMECYGFLKSTRAGEDRNWWSPQESTRQCRSALYVRGRRGRSSARRSISTVRPIHTKTIPERYSSSTARAKFSPTILTEKFVMRALSYVQLGR
jgi:hypothetical protein